MNHSLDLRYAREMVEAGYPVCHDEPLSTERGQSEPLDKLSRFANKEFRDLPNVWEIRRSKRQPLNT